MQAIKDKSNSTKPSDKIPQHLKSRDTSWIKNQPLESVLLFDGAITHTPLDQCSEEKSYSKMVVYCDGCKQQINSIIHCCQTCWDYDLCSQCFPELSRTHANGMHKFAIEDVGL